MERQGSHKNFRYDTIMTSPSHDIRYMYVYIATTCPRARAAAATPPQHPAQSNSGTVQTQGGATDLGVGDGQAY